MRRLVVAAMAAVLAFPVSAWAVPGGVFVTGHDPDFHSIAGNTTGARNIIRRAVEFVSGNVPAPSLLVVSSRISVPSGHLDSVQGIQAAGFAGFDVAAAPGQGVLDLNTVDFAGYDAVIIASDFGGLLRQNELDILNSRTGDLVDYVNGGGGLVALSESNQGAHLTPAGGLFDFLPFLATELALGQPETNYTVTPFGQAMGLLASDVNGNVSHNVFLDTGGMEVVDRDGAGRILSLAVRGKQICAGGVPSLTIGDVTVAEGAAGDVVPAIFTLALSTPVCGEPLSVDVSTADGTAEAGSDYSALPSGFTVTFQPGESSKQVTVGVSGDGVFEPDETFLVDLASNTLNVADAQGIGTIANDDPDNQAPDCSSVAADPGALWPPSHKLRDVTLRGATDPDGDTVAVAVTGVTQDEALNGLGDGDSSPDAAAGATADSVRLRAERQGGGDGRVYRIAFAGEDPDGASCTGTATVGVPHDQRGGAAVDSGGSVDSFG